MQKVIAREIMYIKLGEAGFAENECIMQGIASLSYLQVPHDLCTTGKWDMVFKNRMQHRKNKGVATRDTNQIKAFYEKPDDVVWITFISDRLHWCRLSPGVEVSTGGTKTRKTIGGWSDKSITGELLLKNKLSGKILTTQGYQGTICSIKNEGKKYLLRKINGEVIPNEQNAREAYEKLQASLIPIITDLNHKDFEILIDLIFSRLGWLRTGDLGGTEKDIDLDLISPMGEERIAIQVKSRATAKIYKDYKARFEETGGYSKFYFVTHTPHQDLIKCLEDDSESNYIYWGPEKISEHAIKCGLIGWLLDKAT